VRYDIYIYVCVCVCVCVCVIRRLKVKLPDRRLQFFEHSSMSIYLSQRIYGGIASALVSSYYEIIDHNSRVYCGLTDYHKYL
jgi:hypothetical protein